MAFNNNVSVWSINSKKCTILTQNDNNRENREWGKVRGYVEILWTFCSVFL